MKYMNAKEAKELAESYEVRILSRLEDEVFLLINKSIEECATGGKFSTDVNLAKFLPGDFTTSIEQLRDLSQKIDFLKNAGQYVHSPYVVTPKSIGEFNALPINEKLVVNIFLYLSNNNFSFSLNENKFLHISW